MNQQKDQRNPDEIGALWLKSGRNGEYWTGTINGQKVVVFPNNRKKSDKHPDMRVLLSRPQGQRVEKEDIPF